MKCEVCQASISINWGSNLVTLCEAHSDLVDELTREKELVRVSSQGKLTTQHSKGVSSKWKEFLFIGFLIGAFFASYKVFFIPDMPVIAISSVALILMLTGLIPILGYFIGLKLKGPGLETKLQNFLAGFIIWQSFNSLDLLGLNTEKQWYFAYLFLFVISILVSWQPFRKIQNTTT
ncbi:MAG: hypothetical protein ACKVJE_05030 [Pseudomonadales bacterium]|jgi:VIT1/CCC1 family predicted Fe2+/Mn2+ transporter